MGYNVCKICGAKDGRAGFLVGNPDKGLVDAPEEIQKTMDILKDKEEIVVKYLLEG